jgi:hypothetical protein
VATHQSRRDLDETEQKADSDSSREVRRTTAGKKRLAAAFAVAAISDALSYWLSFVPPVQWVIDLATALLLFLLLGRKWAILPGLIGEAIPGLNLFPLWLLVVGSIAIWGAVRRPRKTEPPPRSDAPPEAHDKK